MEQGITFELKCLLCDNLFSMDSRSMGKTNARGKTIIKCPKCHQRGSMAAIGIEEGQSFQIIKYHY